MCNGGGQLVGALLREYTCTKPLADPGRIAANELMWSPKITINDRDTILYDKHTS